MPKKQMISQSKLPTLEEASADPLEAIEAWKQKLEKSDTAYHTTLNRGLGVLFASTTAILAKKKFKRAAIERFNSAGFRKAEISLPVEDDEFFRLVSEYVFKDTQSPNRASKYGRVLDMLSLRGFSVVEAARVLSEVGVEKLYRMTTSELPVKGLSKSDKRLARSQFSERHADGSQDVSQFIDQASALQQSDDGDENETEEETGNAKTTGSAKPPTISKSIAAGKTSTTTSAWEDDDIDKMRLPVGARVSNLRETLHTEMKSADLTRVLTGEGRQFAISVRVDEPDKNGWTPVRAFHVDEID